VRCFTAAGAPVDTYFTATFADHVSILANGQAAGNAWIDKPVRVQHAVLVLPVGLGRLDGHHDALRRRQLRGAHAEHRQHPARLRAATSQVTGYGSDPNRCKVSSWSSSGLIPSHLTANVRCFTPAGAAVDERFVVQFTR